MIGEIKDADWMTYDTIQYLFFFFMIIMYFIGNRQCHGHEPAIREIDNASEVDYTRTWKEAFCDNRDTFTINVGVAFLCLVSGRLMYTRT